MKRMIPFSSKLTLLFPSGGSLSRLFGIDQSISKKIGFGYALALGTAVIGTSVGLLGGSYYARPAQIQAQKMLHKKQLLNDFDNRLLRIQLHPQRLLAIAGEGGIWLQYETNQFRIDLQQLHRLLDTIEQLMQENSRLNADQMPLLTAYRQSLQDYETFAQRLQDTVTGRDDEQIATEVLVATLSSSSVSELSTTFERLSEDLTRLQQTVDQQYVQATTQLQRAEQLRVTLILSSMTISIGLAIALAVMTSRAIARPIEHLTSVARRVTQDNNFHLQAPIYTRDEVSLLAQALNQLVSWAGQYTTELEDARQTLEDRVDERTKALMKSEESLRLKASDLQHALDELRQTQLHLIQSEKMSSLGQMVAGVAHEINNPVSFIYGNLQYVAQYRDDMMRLLRLYQRDYPEPNAEINAVLKEVDFDFLQQDFPEVIQSMEEGTTRIRDIVKSLRTFSRLDEAALKEVDVHAGLDSTLTILGNRLKVNPNSSGIKIVRRYGSLPVIECYAGQINQVFMNVLINAIDALELSSEAVDPTITITTQVIDSRWISIMIADNGPGIPEAIVNRLFEPFFTTKDVGSGTGLGLSISYQIVTETHGGYLGCESIPGRGAIFSIKLPIKLESSCSGDAAHSGVSLESVS